MLLLCATVMASFGARLWWLCVCGKIVWAAVRVSRVRSLPARRSRANVALFCHHPPTFFRTAFAIFECQSMKCIRNPNPTRYPLLLTSLISSGRILLAFSPFPTHRIPFLD